MSRSADPTKHAHPVHSAHSAHPAHSAKHARWRTPRDPPYSRPRSHDPSPPLPQRDLQIVETQRRELEHLRDMLEARDARVDSLRLLVDSKNARISLLEDYLRRLRRKCEKE